MQISYKPLIIFLLVLSCLSEPLLIPNNLSHIQSLEANQNDKMIATQNENNQNQITIKDEPNDQSPVFIREKDYIGEYVSAQNSSLFDYLTSQIGTIKILFFQNQFSNSIQLIDSLSLTLFDPIYHDQRAAYLLIQLGKMVSPTEWVNKSAKALIKKAWKQRYQSEQTAQNVSLTIKLSNIQNNNGEQVLIDISLIGENFNFSTSAHYSDTRLSTLGYCLYTSAVVILQIISAFFLIKKADSLNPNIMNKLSLTTVALCNIEDFYLTMIHIEYIMTQGSNTYWIYTFPSICYIILFVMFDMKLLFLVWRSHYMGQVDNPQALRKKLTTFYIKFYVGLFVYLFLLYFFAYDPWMITIQNLIMIPQIIYNVRQGNNPGFEPLYTIGYMGVRILLPFYERACPNNHFMLTPIYGLVGALFALYFVQILVLFFQSKIGPRFFIPKMFQPDYYNYNFKIKPTLQNIQLQCSICLQAFFNIPPKSLAINSSEIDHPLVGQQENGKGVGVMKTPCSHFFHKECLVNWIDVKLECPTCRSPLPPI